MKPMFTFMVSNKAKLPKRIFFPKKEVVIDYPDTFQQRLKNTIYTPEMIKKVVFTFLERTIGNTWITHKCKNSDD
jgi:hypothetical protein